jgi:hypothetical protein
MSQSDSTNAQRLALFHTRSFLLHQLQQRPNEYMILITELGLQAYCHAAPPLQILEEASTL